MTGSEGRTALVTGAGQGTGRGIALALAGEGAAVALVGRAEAKLVAVAEEISARGGRALPLVGDVTDGDRIDAIVKETVAELGSLDVLVNTAQAYTFGGLLDVNLDDVEVGWTSGALATLRFMRAAHHAVRRRTRRGTQRGAAGRPRRRGRRERGASLDGAADGDGPAPGRPEALRADRPRPAVRHDHGDVDGPLLVARRLNAGRMPPTG